LEDKWQNSREKSAEILKNASDDLNNSLLKQQKKTEDLQEEYHVCNVFF